MCARPGCAFLTESLPPLFKSEIGGCRSDVTLARHERFSVGGELDGQRRLLVEPLHESLDERRGDVLDDDDRRRKIRAEATEEFDEGGRTAGRCADDDAFDIRAARSRPRTERGRFRRPVGRHRLRGRKRSDAFVEILEEGAHGCRIGRGLRDDVCGAREQGAERRDSNCRCWASELTTMIGM